MVQKETKIKVLDTCHIMNVKCIQVYQKKNKDFGYVGDFLKVAAKLIAKRFKRRFRGKKFKSILVMQNKRYGRVDGSSIFFKESGCVVLKKRLTPKGKLVRNVTIYNIKRKKFLASFVKVL